VYAIVFWRADVFPARHSPSAQTSVGACVRTGVGGTGGPWTRQLELARVGLSIAWDNRHRQVNITRQYCGVVCANSKRISAQ
jgi:hypothetical protein